MKLKKIFLISLVVSLALAAMLGVLGVVTDSNPDGHLLGTMGAIALFSLTLLGTAVVLEKRVWRAAMVLSVAISAIGLVVFLAGIWLSRYITYPYNDWLEHLMAQLAVVAVALPLAGLLALTRFNGTLLRSARLGFISSIFVTAGLFALLIWSSYTRNWTFGSQLGRPLAVACIMTALGLIALPLMYKLVGMPVAPETVAVDLRIKLVCPRCAANLEVPSGRSQCAVCKLRFEIAVEEPRCPACSYLLYKLTEPRCPECGRELHDTNIAPADSAASAGPAI